MSTSIPNEHNGGFLVVRRVNWFDGTAVKPVMKRTPAVALSHQEILTVYRGFEGEAWPDCEFLNGIHLQAGLASLDQHKLVEEYYQEISRENLCDMLCIGFHEEFNPLHYLPAAYLLLGYDYGFYLSETGIFSSLFHEVIYGMYSEMRQFSGLLNDVLLLPTIESAKELELTRNSLLASGADLEGYEKCQAIVIYGIKN
jgi:hypothetical protein